MLCGLRAGWGRRRAADAAGPGPRSLGGEPRAEAGGAGARCGGGWDAPAGRLWGQIASRGEAAEWGPRRRPPGSAMAAQCDPLSGYLPPPLSDPGSNSERSADSPAPGSEEDSAGPPRPLHSPEWGEERFRVDRKKLEAMLQGEGGSGGGARGARGGGGGREGREGAPDPAVPCPGCPFPARKGAPSCQPLPRALGAGLGRREPRGPVPAPGAVVASRAGAGGSCAPGAEPGCPAPYPGVRCRLGPGRAGIAGGAGALPRRGSSRAAGLRLWGCRCLRIPAVKTERPARAGPCGLSAFEERAGGQGVPAGAAGTAPQS